MFGNTFKKTYSHVDPDDPIPEIEIGIFNFVSNQITKDNFTIDSGSSITCINERIFDILDLQYHRTVSIQYADGTEMDQYTCLVDLELPQINFKELKLEVILHQQDAENLLGRDILNKLSLFLYGRKRMFKIKN